jgi:toluene monooxygenase system ferredoxin subunit
MGWQVACTVSDLAENEMKEFDLGGASVLVARNTDGFFAYPPLCPHQESELAFGTCDGDLITCMTHLWQWDMRSGAPVGLAAQPLKLYPTRIEGDRVFVLLD